MVEMSTASLLTPKEVAALLRVSVKTVYKYVKMGKLKCVRLPSGRIRFSREDLLRELEAWGELHESHRIKATRLIVIRS